MNNTDWKQIGWKITRKTCLLCYCSIRVGVSVAVDYL